MTSNIDPLLACASGAPASHRAPISANDVIRASWWDEHPNWGDNIAPIIIEKLSGRRVVNTIGGSGRHVTVGSLMHSVYPYDHVWGTGMLEPIDFLAEGVTIHAVRGPLTRAALARIGVRCPEIYGDPGFLMPYIYRPRRTREIAVGIVPHYEDLRYCLEMIRGRHHVIDICSGVKEVMQEVARCEVVLSSSLHGIILAESLGIPAQYVRMSDGLVGGDFKFQDYYLATGGRPCRPTDWREGVDVEAAVAAARANAPAKIDLRPLLAACPFNYRGITRPEDIDGEDI